MSKEAQIVKEFYKALSKGDYQKVNSLYHDDAKYRDEIFDLRGKEINALWYTATRPEMNLIAHCKSLKVDGDRVTTDWNISYTIDTLNRKVELDETGVFQFQDGKIINHKDSYDFWSWCAQSLGFIGKALGWSQWLKNRVRNQAKKSVLSNMYAAQESFILNDRARKK